MAKNTPKASQPPVVVRRLISELTYDPENARKHGDADLEAVCKSLKKFKQQTPIVVTPSGIVAKGNGTMMAAQKLGWTHIDTVVTYLTGDELTAYKIADNQTALLSEWDLGRLSEQLVELEESPELFEVLSFDDSWLSENLPEHFGLEESKTEVVEDEVPEPPVNPITKPGDLWILGEHRLLCGDSTKAADVARLMIEENYELLMIDPPYGIKAASMTMGSAQSSKPKHDRLSNVKQWDGSRPKIAHLITGKACVWGGNYFAHDLPISDDWLCWWKKNDNLSFGEFELAWCNYGKRTRHLSHHWGGEKKEHITQKPVAVIAWAIQQSETVGLICDLFLGSGTTLIAAEQLNRKCYGMEISPAYCDVVVKRWENLTGKKAHLESQS